MKNSKKIIITFLLITAQITSAQNDKKEIEKQIDQMASDWSTHKFNNMDSYTTQDVQWVNIVGMWWKGRTEVKLAHQQIFDVIFKNVPITKKSTEIRLVTKDVAIATVICNVGEFSPPDGIDHGNNKNPASDNIMTLVYVKKNGKWLLSAGQNTVIDARAIQNK